MADFQSLSTKRTMGHCGGPTPRGMRFQVAVGVDAMRILQVIRAL